MSQKMNETNLSLEGKYLILLALVLGARAYGFWELGHTGFGREESILGCISPSFGVLLESSKEKERKK